MTYIRKVIGVIPPCPCPNGEGSESSTEQVSEAVAQATHSLQRELTNLGEGNTRKFGSKLKRKVIGKTYDGPKGSNTPPKMDADTPVVGTENAFARGDHQHPHDTTKADVTALVAERNRAMDAETALGNRITTNSNAINAEKQRAQLKEQMLQQNINTESQRAQEAEQQLRALYQALTETETIPVSELPASGEANKIYRVAGDGNYSDYMWNGTEWVLMATYDNDIDDEPTLGSNNLVKSGGVAGMYGHYTDNPEFLYVMTDLEQRILLALRKDGQVMFGAGVPYQVKEYVDAKIAEILGDDDLTEKIDSLKEIVAFLENFKNSDKLKQMLDAKVDKEEGKSLIDAEYANRVSYIENPEFLDGKTDQNQRLLEGTRVDGTKVLTGDVEIEKNLQLRGKVTNTLHVDKISQDGFVTEVIDNPEWKRLLLTEDGRIVFGIRNDGSIDWGVGVPVPIQKAIEKIYEDGILNSFKYVSNPEYLLAVTDNEGHFLFGVTVEGVFRVAKLELPESEVETWLDEVYSIIEDPEDRLEITLDKDSRVLGYRDKDGTRYEEKFKTNHLSLTPTGMTEFQQALKDSGFNPDTHKDARDYHIPQYGTVNIKSETFYLTADSRYSDKSGVYLIQDWADTDENAKRDKDTGQIHESGQPVSLCSYYIKSTLRNDGGDSYSKYNDGVEGHDVQLDFYAANKVTKVGNAYYVSNTLVDGQPVTDSVEVTQIVDVPSYKAWPVEKKSEHYCIADINFGHYLTKNNVPLGIKYQGQSTMYRRKRNFRITFYKKSDYKKKDKIKLGELVRLSGYNLKANWSDNTRIKELLLYRVILDVWFNRPYDDRFPWDKEFGRYTGATGFINGFPCQVNIGGEFYGLDVFALKKDEKNYMLDGDDDASGIFLCGAQRNATHWKHGSVSEWEDEMMDEMSTDTSNALYAFLKFISTMFEGSDGNPYRWHELTYFVDDVPYDFSKVGNKDGKIYLYPEYGEDEITSIYVTTSLVDGAPGENSISAEFVGLSEEGIAERMDVQGFIDYFICMQSFAMWDSICRNMILHTRSDKKKFYPYFYDLDLSMNHAYDADIFDIAYDTINGQRRTNDMTLWDSLIDIYWDEIVNRYSDLRKGVLSNDYIKSLYHKATDAIPDNDFNKERAKWGNSGDRTTGDGLINKIIQRLNWLDTDYFKI